MKRFALIFLFTFLLSPKIYSQRCGGGILTFNIYTLNGEDVKEFDYEIFPVSKELLQKNFYEKLTLIDYKDCPQFSPTKPVETSGRIIGKVFADQIIDNNDPKLNAKLQELLDTSAIAQKGTITSTLLFSTRENQSFPIVLKISNGDREVYILGNYFGNCDREASLVWGDKVLKLE
ncbi:hypothetical protein V1389_04460 [Flavobacterium rakeshii]|uniref:hypothetical protein n=1 Tax=Flavobacterium rakeshii TaxID=1038845 RepID=UPI002E7C3235|nr:hypothetical protein [Flavobacterium rakeshii]MEE1897574.1 hypothetical protein [Flavobacterium rakeshii]